MTSPREGVAVPAFIIIGTMKGGTSSLHQYLSEHPEIPVRGSHQDLRRGIARIQQVAPAQVRDALAHLKLIYVLRDPIDRIVSHYLHNRVLGQETRPLAAPIAAGAYRNNYVRTSMYGFQLAAFLPHFPLERILIATSEALKDERAETLRRMFRFIGVDPHFASGKFDRLVDHTPPAEASEPAALDREDRDRLAEHLAPDLEELRALTGLRFERWSL